jgi:membrane fusion protein (multidrug efflux system)
MRSLERPERPVLWLVPALAVLAAWLTWMTCARVAVYASAETARVEVSAMANRVSALEEGKIVTLHCALGSDVKEGEVLVEIDSSVERAQLDEQLADLSRLRVEAGAIREQITAERVRRESRVRMDGLATEQAAFSLQQAEVAATRQQELTSVAQQLHEQRFTARLDALNAEAELAGTRLKVANASVEVDRLRASQQYEDRSELAQIAELERQLAELEADQLMKLAAIETVKAKIARRRIVAPVSGRLGNITPLQVGDVVKSGEVIATVIPTDDVHVVAELAPDDAVGRVLPGQPARVRLRAFSWLEFGMVDATVRHVASEPLDGTIRVELAMDGRGARDIPMQHGLTGSVDIRIDEAAPWVLLMRSIGSTVGKPAEPEAQSLSASERRP